MGEPIDDLQEPQTKEVTRLSVYFTGGVAHDYTIDEGDDLVAGEKGFSITHKNGIHETILFANVCWYREAKLTVKVKK